VYDFVIIQIIIVYKKKLYFSVFKKQFFSIGNNFIEKCNFLIKYMVLSLDKYFIMIERDKIMLMKEENFNFKY